MPPKNRKEVLEVLSCSLAMLETILSEPPEFIKNLVRQPRFRT